MTAIYGYQQAKADARYWARIALDNKRDGLAWQTAAANAHASMVWALLVIA